MIDSILQSQFVSQLVQGQIRHWAGGFAFWLVAHGLEDKSQEQATVGALFFLGVLAWSALGKFLTRKRVQNAIKQENA